MRISILTVLLALFTLTSCLKNESTESVKTLNTRLKGEVSGTVTLDPSITYSLSESYTVVSGGKLIIPAGTEIIASKFIKDAYIVVLMGGQIEINGTNDNPVIMRGISNKTGETGEWGGLIICGKGYKSNVKNDDEAEVGDFEYGGTDELDYSGSIRNLVIQGASSQINTNTKYNGLSLYAVGSETVLENIAIIDGMHDGIAFFGGSVNVKNLYIENISDDAIDWTQGWNGTIENAYILRTKEVVSEIAAEQAILEGYSSDIQSDLPKIKNITALSTVGGIALQFKKKSGVIIEKLHLDLFEKNIDLVDPIGSLSNITIENNIADINASYVRIELDISTWEWYKKRKNKF